MGTRGAGSGGVARRACVFAAAGIVGIAVRAANAQDEGEGEGAASAVASGTAQVTPPERIDPEWRLIVQPVAWYVAPSGKLKMPVTAGSGGGSFSSPGDEVRVERMNLDSSRFEPGGEILLNSERWRFTVSGATFGIDREATIADSSFRLGSVEVASGDAMDVSLRLTTAEITGGYRVWGRDFRARSERPAEAVETTVRVYALLGARMYDLSFDLTNRSGGASTGADEFFAEPIIGARGELDLAEQFSMNLQITAGGFADSDRSSLSLDIAAGFHWRPSRHVGLVIGYRQLAFDLADGEDLDEFEYNGRLAGLFAGLTVRF